MREIKFKAWDKDAKEMYIQGMNTTENNSIMECMFYLDDFGVSTAIRIYGDDKFRDVVNSEIMQYTGFKDKNGKEIYEGDILRDSFKNAFDVLFEPENYKVIFIDGGWCFLGKKKENWSPDDTELDFYSHFETNSFSLDYYDDDCNLKNFEVIGNIYENSELLEE